MRRTISKNLFIYYCKTKGEILSHLSNDALKFYNYFIIIIGLSILNRFM